MIDITEFKNFLDVSNNDAFDYESSLSLTMIKLIIIIIIIMVLDS